MDDKKIKRLLEKIQSLSKQCQIKDKKIQLLEDTQFNYEYILANIPSHVYWLDKNLTYLGCNDEHAKTIGLKSRKDIVGKTNFDMPWKGQADLINKLNQEIIRTGKSQKKEEFTNIDNVTRYYISEKSPLRNKNNEVVGLLGISVDITKQKLIESELEKSKNRAETASYIMTEFIANMGHDLATPISDIGSIAEVLSYYGDEYPELKDLFAILIKRSDDCEAVRKRIINATSVSNLKIKNESFSIVSELVILTKELKHLIGSKPLKLIIKPLKPKKEDIIRTDRSKFHDILYDLISNAINFTEKGEVNISVFKQDTNFHIKVTDTGIGIPQDKFEYIFEQYTKLTRSNQYGASFKGVGAGLYLARIRANIINARISVESTINKRTQKEFSLYWQQQYYPLLSKYFSYDHPFCASILNNISNLA